jgi:hypothetical protein
MSSYYTILYPSRIDRASDCRLGTKFQLDDITVVKISCVADELYCQIEQLIKKSWGQEGFASVSSYFGSSSASELVPILISRSGCLKIINC